MRRRLLPRSIPDQEQTQPYLSKIGKLSQHLTVFCCKKWIFTVFWVVWSPWWSSQSISDRVLMLFNLQNTPKSVLKFWNFRFCKGMSEIISKRTLRRSLRRIRGHESRVSRGRIVSRLREAFRKPDYFEQGLVKFPLYSFANSPMIAHAYHIFWNLL